MGAVIRYRRIKSERDPFLSCDAPQSFICVIKRAFGSMPLQLSAAEIPVIRGIIAGHGPTNQKAFEQLIELLQESSIEIRPEY